MKNLLLHRLNNLEKDIFFRFDAFIRSPYFHKGEKAAEFMDIIQPFYPNFNENTISQLKKANSSQKSYEVLMSRINDLLDEFELYELFAQKKYLQNALKYELELDKKNNVKLYYQLQHQQKQAIQSSDDLYAEYYKEFTSIAVCENNWLADKDQIVMHSEQAMSNILHFFLSKYLMIYANKATHTFSLLQKSEIAETQVILNFVADNLETQPLSVQCVFYIVQLFKNINGGNDIFDLYFNRLKTQTFVLENEEISYEIKYALIQSVSACVFKCISEPSYLQNAFEMVEFLVEKDLYFTLFHDQLIQQRFIMIVKIAIGANQINWAKQFVEDKITIISKNSQKDMHNYASGLIYFNQKEYINAMKLMLKVNLNSIQFIVDCKTTLLKINYELDDITGFNYQSQTFLKFINKDKSLNKTHKKNVLDSIEFIKLLFKYKKNKSQDLFIEKLEFKKIDYLISNYRDKWFAEKLNPNSDKKQERH